MGQSIVNLNPQVGVFVSGMRLTAPAGDIPGAPTPKNITTESRV